MFNQFPVFHTHQEFTCTRSIMLADNSILSHVIDHSCCSTISNPEGALQERTASSTFSKDNFDRTFVQIISFANRLRINLAFLINFQVD